MSKSMQKREDSRVETVAERPSVAPRCDIFENKDELLLVADLPGVTQDTLRIHLDSEQLSLEGRPAEEPEGTPLQREFRLVDYRRSFLVPDVIDREKVSAELKNGVLHLHLPKSAAVKPRRIEVKAG